MMHEILECEVTSCAMMWAGYLTKKQKRGRAFRPICSTWAFASWIQWSLVLILKTNKFWLIRIIGYRWHVIPPCEWWTLQTIAAHIHFSGIYHMILIVHETKLIFSLKVTYQISQWCSLSTHRWKIETESHIMYMKTPCKTGAWYVAKRVDNFPISR